MLKIKAGILITAALLITIASSGQTVKNNWMRISGKWEIKDSILSCLWENSATWGYYALMDRNSILSMEPLVNPSSFSFRMLLTKTQPQPGEFWAAIGTRALTANWNYHAYAVVFYCDQVRISKISLVLTDQVDSTKPFNTKNNYCITELSSLPADIAQGIPLDVYLKLENKTVSMYINNVLTAEFVIPDDKFSGFDGKVGFAAKNVLARMEYAKATSGSDVVLDDGFDLNSLYVPTV